MATVEFLGAAGTVTGSKFLIEAAGQRLLVDCGLYQGLKELRLRNWDRLPVEPASIDWLVLTHGHIDHSGYLPRLMNGGLRGRAYATRGTADLLRILLPDSGHLQEEEAVAQPAILLSGFTSSSSSGASSSRAMTQPCSGRTWPRCCSSERACSPSAACASVASSGEGARLGDLQREPLGILAVAELGAGIHDGGRPGGDPEADGLAQGTALG